MEPATFSGGFYQGVSAPVCCDSILGVTFEEAPDQLDLA